MPKSSQILTKTFTGLRQLRWNRAAAATRITNSLSDNARQSRVEPSGPWSEGDFGGEQEGQLSDQCAPIRGTKTHWWLVSVSLAFIASYVWIQAPTCTKEI